jgi:hypothetical protein
VKVKEMLTTDEGVFEFVKQHLLNQGQKSEGKSSCFYKQKNGLSCAIGCLIENEFYNDNLEFKNGDDPIVIDAVTKSLPNWVINKNMLLDLQVVHDEYEVEEWECKLQELEEQTFHREELLRKDDEEIRKLLNYEN